MLGIEVEGRRTGTGSCGPELPRNMLMLAVAFERELDMLRSAKEVGEFEGRRSVVGRSALEELAKEKRAGLFGLGNSDGEEERYRRRTDMNSKW